MSADALIIVVDDNADMRDSMRALLEASGLRVRSYASAMSFLADSAAHASCMITDIRMPEMDGLALQVEMTRRGIDLPVIVMTGHGDVPMAVRAMKAGAVDFIEKPFDSEAMLAAVHRALLIGGKARDRAAEAKAANELLDHLTPREQAVMEKLVAGRSNKVAAYELGISPRTIEIHRARIMDKMSARSLSDIVRIAIAAGRPANGSA